MSFLQGNGRYQEALAVADNPERFVRELQEAGYATDPQYARKLKQVLRSDAIAGYSMPGNAATRNTEMEL